ncbi:MAG: YlbF family regulator [Halanaerobacter sp.]
MSLEEKAEELAASIEDSDEFQALKEAEKKVEEDDEAKSILEKFQTKQQQMQMMQQAGGNINEAMKDEIESLRADMQENEIISGLMSKQQEFNKIMEEVNQVLSKAIQGEDAHHGHDHEHGQGCCC